MWVTLNNRNQITQGSLVKFEVLEGHTAFETKYRVAKILKHYFMLELIEQKGRAISFEDGQYVPHRIESIQYYGYEVWVEGE